MHAVFVPALALLFFCSGAAALIYQLLWLRMLGWVFGVTVYAASTVWATFMAGLAIGSLAAGLLGDRVRSPLRWFGACEILIGATAFATPWAIAWMQQAYASVYPSISDSIGQLTAVRVVIAFAALIVPTALMGATLPLVVRASTIRASRIREQIGVLYGSNAAGAIVGTLAAGLYLMPELGIRRSFLAAAILNVAIGAAAIALSRVPLPAAAPAMAPAQAGAGVLLSRKQLLIILGVFTLSGVVSLGVEVVWFRGLTLFIRPTVYGFAVMLATVLAGISIGSYLVTPWLTRPLPWMTLLAAIHAATAATIVLSFAPLVWLPSFAGWLTPIVGRVLPEYLGYPVAGSLLAILPASLLMGMAFPIGLHLWTTAGGDRHERTAARIGRFYAMNVGGAIVGSLLAGFLLLPRLGSQGALVVLASLSGIAALALLAASELSRAGRGVAGIFGVSVFALALWHVPDPFGMFIAQRFPGPIAYAEEGIDATVVVHEGARRSMTINGTHQAGADSPTTFVHRRLGHLPMLVHPDPKSALVVGLGGGATAGAVSIHGGLVDVVELSRPVIRGARFFEAINYGVLDRPNVRLRIDDGRNYLMLTAMRYDVVTADLIQPIYAGSGNLYSEEYFRLMRRVLRPGGMAVQWVWGTEEEYKAIARTFLRVFPEATLWVDGSLLIGSVEPLRLRPRDFDMKRYETGGHQAMADLAIHSFEDLLAAFTAGPEEIREFVGEGLILTDDRPLTEYFLSLPRDREPDLRALGGDARKYVVE